MIDTKVEVSVSIEEINTVADFVDKYDNKESVSVQQPAFVSNVSKYLTSLASGQYQKSINDIENTKVGNRITRKRDLQQVMQESFFYGANRFGNNFIA